MLDLFPFFAWFAAFVFGIASALLILAAMRISDLVADEAQFHLPSDPEHDHAARTAGR